MKNKALSFYTGVFLVSGLVMALQILQSRLLSVTTWYHLSFLVISIAMFGLTLGALKIYRSSEEEQRENYGSIARYNCVWFGIFTIIGLIVQLYIPIVSQHMSETLIRLPLAALATSMAYYHAGIVITLCLTRAPYPVGKTYGIDLLGAGLGCIGALVLMETINTPSAIFFIASLAFLSALAFPETSKNPTEGMKKFKKAIVPGAVITCLLGCVNLISPQSIFYPIWTKGKYMPMSQIDYVEWNSISRVTVGKENVDAKPFLWGESAVLPKDLTATSKLLVIDGDAGTPITKFDGDFSKHSYLEYDVINLAYSLPNVNAAAIIGVGGGRDLMSAKYFGVEKVTALDVNPVQIKLLKDHPVHREYANLYDLPGVTIKNEEARSWFRNNTEKVDLVQMSLIDTWASTGAGAFALSENGLYTVEAWTIFMNDLTDHGVFTVSRWSSSVIDDTGRTLSVAMAALYNQGIENARDHIVLAKSGLIATIIVSKSPFTQEQLDAIKKTAAEKQYKIVLMPGQAVPEEGILKDLIVAQSTQELEEIASKQFYDVSPSTDMRPFFFNQARLSKPVEVTKMALRPPHWASHVSLGQAKATFNLYLIILFSAVVVAMVIIVPLSKTVEDKSSTFIKAGTLYFMLIGAGFMFIEISLLQALGVFLGHPIYGLSVVLFSLIISAGLGSLVSEKVPLNTTPKQIAWAMATCLYAVVLAFIFKDIFYQYAEVDIMTRVIISVSMLLPAGFLMGFGFPTGLSITEKFDTRATAWFWGINGATGVLGSSVAIALNIAFGIDNTMIVGGVCYALLTISFLALASAAKKA